MLRTKKYGVDVSQQSRKTPCCIWLALVLPCACGLGADLLTGAPSILSNLPPHPRLLLNREGVEQLRRRIDSESWAKTSWNELRSRAESQLAESVNLPPRGGNWSHNYVCPTHGARLERGRQLAPWQWEHVCPVGNHRLRGDPSRAALDFDGNVISGIHGNFAEAVVRHGLVFQITGQERHAAKAREILLAYAGRYSSYPLHDNQGNAGRGGHVASQSLTEASWLIDVAQGADLVWTTLSESDRAAIKDNLLLPALKEVILPRRLGIHNIQCRHNSAIGLVGFLIGDAGLVATAIDDPQVGFHQQMQKGVLADGLWLEGSSGYHYFTLAGLWPLTEAARNCGINLYGPKLKALFDGPLALAMPDFVLPNFNDSGTVPLRNQGDLYELALARYGDAAYGELLRGSQRQGRLALLFGTPQLPALTATNSLQSRNLAASGYAILQQGRGPEATWLALKYGPHGGGHGHPDKNTFILYAQGEICVTDAGTHAYGSSLHRDWDKTTLAHNTLIVDETSQAAATGRCIAFGAERGVDFAVVDAGPIYPGVRFVRTVAMLTPELMIFIDQIKAERPRLLDIACHLIGAWTNEPSSGKPLKSSKEPGYTRLSDLTSREVSDGQRAFSVRTRDGRVSSVITAANEPTEIITGQGVLKTTEDKVPILLQRRRASETAFVWALSLNRAAVTLKARSAIEEKGQKVAGSDAIGVEVVEGRRQWLLTINPQKLNLRVAGSSDANSTAIFSVAGPAQN